MRDRKHRSAEVRVLIADDSPPYRRAASDVVRSTAGFELVGVAASGDEAVELAAQLEADLVLLDVRMPGTNGIDAARAIAASQPETMIVLISAWRKTDYPPSANGCGAAATLDKRELTPTALADLWDRNRAAG